MDRHSYSGQWERSALDQVSLLGSVPVVQAARLEPLELRACSVAAGRRLTAFDAEELSDCGLGHPPAWEIAPIAACRSPVVPLSFLFRAAILAPAESVLAANLLPPASFVFC